jgi:hypothetical protein
MDEMELLLPRAKKEVCERRSVVRVMAVGERSMRARVKLDGQQGVEERAY